MRRLAAVVAVVAAIAGCGGGGAPTLSAADLRRAVLQPADVGGGYTRLEDGPGAAFDAPRGSGALGRTSGWLVRFRAASAAGKLQVVTARIDLFPDAGAASKQLDDYRIRFGTAAVRPHAKLGGGAAGYALRQASTTGAVRFYGIAWRYGNAVAYLLAQGANGLTMADAERLAVRQQQRMAAAA